MSTRMVVVGDVLLDVDIEGRVDTVRPGVAAPLIDDPVEKPRPGGAGLAAALMAAEGSEVTLVTALASDPAAQKLRLLLEEWGVRVIDLGRGGETSETVHVRASGQSVMRIERGGFTGEVGPWLTEAERAIDRSAGVLVSDYGGGITGRRDVREALARSAPSRPMVWDPHPQGTAPVPGASMVTPSRTEAFLFAGMREMMSLAGVSACAHELARRWKVVGVCVTLGAEGALYRTAGPGSPYVVPAPVVDVFDAHGAGDRFAGAVTVALGRGASAAEATAEAVASASAFVGSGGVAGWSEPGPEPVPAGESAGALAVIRRVRSRGGTVVATGGSFDLLHAGHVRVLKEARSLGDCLIVCINSDESVRRVKGPTRPIVGVADRKAVLESLSMVDAVVVFDEDTPEAVLEELQPDVWAKGGDYQNDEPPEASVLAKWGGACVVLPYSEGRSTTNLMKEVISRGGNG